jgi:hypothetical protein
VVGYWRSVAEGAIDRQVVIRMLAPPDKAADLQKVAKRHLRRHHLSGFTAPGPLLPVVSCPDHGRRPHP